jgi:thiamine biosynthesis lipoprotein
MWKSVTFATLLPCLTALSFSPRSPLSHFPFFIADPHVAEAHVFTQVHMGMPVRLSLYAGDEKSARAAAEAAFARVAALDAMLSDYRPDSELNRLANRAGQWADASPDLMAVVTRAVEIADVTGGAFDPTVAPVVQLWREARRSRRLPDDAALASAHARVGWQRIEVDRKRAAIRLAPGTRLDLGGIAKGYVLQEALRVLDAQGTSRALVEAGGDIVAGDAPPGRDGWRVDTPGAGDDFAARARHLARTALATSGASMQFVEIDGVRYSHVIDPRTGRALTHTRQAFVIAADGMTADALATALTVLNGDDVDALLARFPDVTAYVGRTFRSGAWSLP